MQKKLSVVIPTYNRPHLLANCLKALTNQTFPFSQYEIVVVSDGPDAETEKVIRSFKGNQQPEITFFSLPRKQGPAAARNLGWRNANGKLIAFTDDDCLPDTNWLTSIDKAYNNELHIAYTGRVVVPVSEKPRDFELNTAGLETAEFVTANCVCTKQALQITGGFDEEFKAAWREDSDLHFKLMLNNIPIHKNEKAVVVHPVRAAGWGISIKEQKKSMFNALLYKKYPQLFRSRIKPSPTWSYYIIVASSITGLFALLAGFVTMAVVLLGVWLLFTLMLTVKRLSRTTRSAGHVVEMFVTSIAIPFLSVYWTLYGACKYRVVFF